MLRSLGSLCKRLYKCCFCKHCSNTVALWLSVEANFTRTTDGFNNQPDVINLFSPPLNNVIAYAEY